MGGEVELFFAGGWVGVVVAVGGIGLVVHGVGVVGDDVALCFPVGGEQVFIGLQWFEAADAVGAFQYFFAEVVSIGVVVPDLQVSFQGPDDADLLSVEPFDEWVRVCAVVVQPGGHGVCGGFPGGVCFPVVDVEGTFAVPGGSIGDVLGVGAELDVFYNSFLFGDQDGICRDAVVLFRFCSLFIKLEAVVEQAVEVFFGDEPYGALQVLFFELLVELCGGKGVVFFCEVVAEGLSAEPGLVRDDLLPVMEVIVAEGAPEGIFCLQGPSVGEVADGSFFEPEGDVLFGGAAFGLVGEAFCCLCVPDGPGDGFVELCFELLVAAVVGDDYSVAFGDEGGQRVGLLFVEPDVAFVALVGGWVDDDVGGFEQAGAHVVFYFFDGVG